MLTDLLRGRMGFTGTVVSDYVGVGWAQTRQRVAATPEEAGALALAAGMDVETPAVYGYGQVLAKAVENGNVPESLLDESVRRVLRDKFALGLFDDPYVPEDPAEIRSVASEGVDLSRRLAAESVTLLKNEKGLLPLSRDIAKIAVIGPHADDVEAGFPAYTYPAALKMMHARATGGDIAMAGVDLGGGAPPEARAAVAAELAAVFKVDRRTTSSPTTRRCPSPRRCDSSCRRPRSPLSRAPEWSRPSRPTFRPQSPRPGMPTSSSSPSAAERHGPTSAPKEKARTPRTRTSRRSRWS